MWYLTKFTSFCVRSCHLCSQTDGQKGTLSFLQDSTVAIMQPGGSSRAQLQPVQFQSFAVSGATARLGTFCYKADGASKEIKVRALAQRVFKAQVLASSTPDSAPAEEPSTEQDGNVEQQQPRRSSRQPPTPQERGRERGAGSRKRTPAESELERTKRIRKPV